MRIGKPVELDNLSIKVLKCMGEIGIVWLTKSINNILRNKRKTDELKKKTNTLVLI